MVKYRYPGLKIMDTVFPEVIDGIRLGPKHYRNPLGIIKVGQPVTTTYPLRVMPEYLGNVAFLTSSTHLVTALFLEPPLAREES